MFKTMEPKVYIIIHEITIKGTNARVFNTKLNHSNGNMLNKKCMVNL